MSKAILKYKGSKLSFMVNLSIEEVGLCLAKENKRWLLLKCSHIVNSLTKGARLRLIKEKKKNLYL